MYSHLSTLGQKVQKKIQKLITFIPIALFPNPILGLGKIEREIRICGQFDIKS